MLKICLCDDDVNTLNYYLNRISDLLNENNFLFEIKTFESGESLIFEMEDDPNKFNIIIIDILMKNINGIETTKILRKYGYIGIILFLTSSKEFALDSFSVEPQNYILKNDNNDRFNKIFLKAINYIHSMSNENIIIFFNKSRKTIINLDSIVYIESLNRKVIFHKINGEVEELNDALKNIYDKIKKYGFIRCHKSYIVNFKYIKSFNNSECMLKKDIILPIGRKYSKSFKNTILENEFDNL